MGDLPAELQRLSGTKLDAPGACNVWAGTTQLDLPACLNRKAGTTGLDLPAALNRLAGTTGLDENAAATAINSAPPAATVLTLPGTSGNYASTPDSAANSITGSVDMRVILTVADWTPATSLYLLVKYPTTVADRSWRWLLTSTGMSILAYNSGGTTGAAASSAAVGLVDGTKGGLRWTWDSVSKEVLFYTSDDAGETWDPLGTPQSMANDVIRDAAGTLTLGAGAEGTLGPLGGTVHYAELRNGIDGSVVAKFDPSAVVIEGTRNPTTVVASTGETWTVNGSAWDWGTA